LFLTHGVYSDYLETIFLFDFRGENTSICICAVNSVVSTFYTDICKLIRQVAPPAMAFTAKLKLF